MSDWKPKRVKGAINWKSPILRSHLRTALSEGVSLRQLAERWEVEAGTLHYHVERLCLNTLPPDLLSTVDVAERLNLSIGGVHALCRRQGIPMGHWGNRRTLTSEQVEALAGREPIVRSRPHGYATAPELARLWGVGGSRVRVMLKGLPRLAWVGGSARVTFLYDLRVASTRAPSVAPARCPAGRWTAAELAAALGVSRVCVSAWATQLDCPVLKGRKDYYFKPAEVAAWLCGRRKRVMRERGEQLTVLLSGRAAA